MPPIIPNQDTLPHPDEFFSIRVRKDDLSPSLLGVCAGYELAQWRCDRLAAHLIEWLPEFALTDTERKALQSHNAVARIAQAARAIYTSDKYQKRGEPGELLLHAIIRQVFETVPAVSKYYFKDSSNDTVKGFDAVHVVASDTELQLWLGEVKFYDDIARAIRDVVKELSAHTQRDYLRSEFAFIGNKIDSNAPHAERLKKLLHRNTSLDEIFHVVCVPVLLTYDSPTVAEHTSITTEFQQAFEQEVLRHHDTFAAKPIPTNVKIHLFLLPLKSKAELMQKFDEKLKACQTMA